MTAHEYSTQTKELISKKSNGEFTLNSQQILRLLPQF